MRVYGFKGVNPYNHMTPEQIGEAERKSTGNFTWDMAYEVIELAVALLQGDLQVIIGGTAYTQSELARELVKRFEKVAEEGGGGQQPYRVMSYFDGELKSQLKDKLDQFEGREQTLLDQVDWALRVLELQITSRAREQPGPDLRAVLNNLHGTRGSLGVLSPEELIAPMLEPIEEPSLVRPPPRVERTVVSPPVATTPPGAEAYKVTDVDRSFLVALQSSLETNPQSAQPSLDVLIRMHHPKELGWLGDGLPKIAQSLNQLDKQQGLINVLLDIQEKFEPVPAVTTDFVWEQRIVFVTGMINGIARLLPSDKPQGLIDILNIQRALGVLGKVSDAERNSVWAKEIVSFVRTIRKLRTQ